MATLGPSSTPQKVLLEMIRSGVDIFRINMAHSDPESFRKTIQMVRGLSKREKRGVSVLADLQGPKIRVGDIPGGPRLLRENATISFMAQGVKPKLGQIPVEYPSFIDDVEVGENILLDDGQMELKITEKRKDRVLAKVRFGGLLRPYKGINLPGSKVSAPSLTPKDLRDLDTVLKNKVDWVGLSFTRSGEDVIRLRKRIRKAKSRAGVVAKIERPEAIKDLTGILLATDAVMVARGDLGVEMGPEEVPILQKQIIREAIQHERPVITATQMLDSMNENPRPTRAEASDVANAILDGTDAIMLASETARGKYPVQTVKTARRIIQHTEKALLKDQPAMPLANLSSLEGKATVDEAAVFAAATAAASIDAKVIVPFTETGRTARLLASLRSRIPIVSFTFHQETFQRMTMYWGTYPCVIPKTKTLQGMYALAEKHLIKKKFARKGDKVILISGTGLVAGATNTMRVHEIGS